MSETSGGHMKTVRLLFNDAMARAIVEGRKTVTRRPVDFRKLPHGVIEDTAAGPWPSWVDEYGDWHLETRQAAPGDLLIGRECWRVWPAGFTGSAVEYRADGAVVEHKGWGAVGGGIAIDCGSDMEKYETTAGRWRPSIHMPDAAARIRRRVVSVTVERLQDIDEDEAVREGFMTSAGLEELFRNCAPPGSRMARPRDNFSAAWESIYAARGLGWVENPYVWRIEFSAENGA